jgi:hypothetical protein
MIYRREKQDGLLPKTGPNEFNIEELLEDPGKPTKI